MGTTTDRIEMILIYNGKLVASANVIKNAPKIDAQRRRWIHTYGLTKKKDWEIHVQIPSTMGIGEPVILSNFRSNPFLNQNLNNETDHNNTEND